MFIYQTRLEISLWLLVIADHVRYMVYAVITDDCRRPDRGFTVTDQQNTVTSKQRQFTVRVKKIPPPPAVF